MVHLLTGRSKNLFPVLFSHDSFHHSKFCACLRKDPREELKRVSVSILFTFLDWVLNLRRGKNGRRLPGTKCKSSLDTFWKVFRLVYERETSNKIGNQMNRQMRRVRVTLSLPQLDPSSLRKLTYPDCLGDPTISQEAQPVSQRTR